MSWLKQLEDKIRQCDLSPEECDELYVFLSGADEKNLQELVALFSESPEKIKLIFRNYRAKKVVLKTQNAAAWQKILLTEYHELEVEEKAQS